MFLYYCLIIIFVIIVLVFPSKTIQITIKQNTFFLLTYGYRLLKRMKWIVKWIPTVTLIHYILFQLDYQILFNHPITSILWLYIFVIIHEIGHILILLYHSQSSPLSFTITFSFFSFTIKHTCQDKTIHSSGIVFLYLFLTLLILNLQLSDYYFVV